MTPNKERITLWVNALKSGKYTQTKNTLHYEGKGFCCLGVACEVAIDNGLPIPRTTNNGGFLNCAPDNAVFYDGEHEVLPESVAEWFGIDTSPRVILVIDEDEELRDVVELNDGGYYTFKELAEFIRDTFGIAPEGK